MSKQDNTELIAEARGMVNHESLTTPGPTFTDICRCLDEIATALEQAEAEIERLKTEVSSLKRSLYHPDFNEEKYPKGGIDFGGR